LRKLSQKFRTTTAILYTYENILLTTYQEIAQTGNLGLLIIKGRPSEKELTTRWEQIAAENGKCNGYDSNGYHENVKDYVRLLATYQGVQASLLQLYICFDDEAIAFLESKGYHIDASTQSKYMESIQNGLQKVKNVITKIKSKYNIIAQYLKENKEKETPLKTSVEEMLANVSAQMGFSVNMDVTLARYNEYNRIIRKRIDAQKNRNVA